ncbi:MAG TPA: DCC1-like thiol-disulfide oxidoreductase family protein [Candidatus Dormibacteraeota bacterium]
MRLARWVQRHDRLGRIEVRPNQETGLAERLGLSREEIGRAVWAFEPGGRRFEGAGAVSRVWRELGGVWRVPGSFYFVPPLKWLEDKYYARVARRRAWW